MTDRVQWQAGRKDYFRTWMDYELPRAIQARQPMEKTWRDYLELYRAPESKVLRRHPFEGASNRTYPLAAMNVDPILARLIRTIHAPSNLWTVTALNADWAALPKPAQDYLQYIETQMLRMHDVNIRVLGEMTKIGTGIYKSGWRFERHNVMGYDMDMNRLRVTRQLNQPVVDHVHATNFVVPPESLSVEPDAQGGAPWVAERLRFRPEQLRALSKAQEPFLPNLDVEATEEVLKYEESAPTEREQTVMGLDQQSWGQGPMRRPIELWEIWARCDTTGNGFEDDIVVLWHEKSRTILRALYHPYAHGRRPYHVGRYVRAEGFWGIGVCEQASMWQHSVSDVLNYNIDKILLTNAPMIAAKEGANILPNEPIYPGKVWFLANPDTDLKPVFLAAPQSPEISQLLGYLQEGAKSRTGLTDLQFGSVGAVPSRTPATTIQALLQEGNTRFDMIIQDLRVNALGPIGLQTLQNIVQQIGNRRNNPEGAAYIELAAMVLGEQPGSYVEELLQLPNPRVETGLGVELTATSGTNNKELQRQSNLALLQVLGNWGPQLIQLAQVAMQAGPTPLGQVALEMFNAAREFLGRTLEQFDVRDADALLPNLSAALQAAQQSPGGQPMATLGAGLQAPYGIPAGTGLPPSVSAGA